MTFENFNWFFNEIYTIYALLVFFVSAFILIVRIMREIVWGDNVSELFDVYLWLVKGFTKITILSVLWPIMLIILTITIVIYYSSKFVEKRVW